MPIANGYHYTDAGKGAPVLLLHGWGCSLQTFAPVTGYLLTQGFRVLALDFPGHGNTPEPEQPLRMADFAAQVLALLDALGIPCVDIIAHSFGARVAILLASGHPARVKRLMLTGAAGIRPKRGIRYYCKVYCYKAAKQAAKSNWLDRAFGLQKRAQNAGSEEYRVLSPVMKGTFSNIVNEDLTPHLCAICAPTLLIWGELDDSTPLYMGKIMQRDISDSALIIFSGCSHYAFVEDINRFCAIAGAFLGGTG